jgi:phosphatidylglycerophosphate synthase
VSKTAFFIINGITLYRVVAAPVLLVLIFTKQLDIFKWLLAVSFFTDLIDGFLARKFNVTSVIGSRLDSIGDDLTVAAGIVGLFVFRYDFVMKELFLISGLLALFIIQIIFALVRYRKISSFHTYLAKTAAVLQGTFLILIFILPEPFYYLFYAAVIVTTADLIEEIILVVILPVWKVNVKGLYWVLKGKEK